MANTYGVVAPIVDVRNVSKSFGSNQVLRSVSFDVDRKKTVCIIGPSGSGKSTLLRCINYLERPDAGSITVNGDIMGYVWKGMKLEALRERDLLRQRQQVGMVFQRFNLFAHLTASENITFALMRVGGQSKAQRSRSPSTSSHEYGSQRRKTRTPQSSRAASSSASLSHERWPWNRR